MSDCLFCKIRAGEIPAEIVYQDQKVIAFNDINPQAPVHILIIPHEHIATINEIDESNADIIGHMFAVSTKLAEQFGLAGPGYRTVINCNRNGGQAVYHIHLHLIGGRQMGWPPG